MTDYLAMLEKSRLFESREQLNDLHARWLETIESNGTESSVVSEETNEPSAALEVSCGSGENRTSSTDREPSTDQASEGGRPSGERNDKAAPDTQESAQTESEQPESEQPGSEQPGSEKSETEKADTGTKRSENVRPEEDTRAFASWLIENGHITQWQSDNIFAGKYKGFFLGKYKLLRSIGAGGMSSVYLAVHTILERQVAIKVLPKSRVTTDSSYLERFLLEAQAVAALDHPNIVRAYDVDKEGESIHYLVMEFIDGPDLLSYVKTNGPMDIYRAAKHIRQAALGLHHAHLAGLIHRDMKPANLLVDKEDNVHVLDLGLARFTDEKRTSLTLTYDENVLGTADYLAPEQARNSHNVDARADIYGLGCTLYYLLLGRVPFPEGTLAQRIAAHQKRMPPRIQDERPEVPDDLAEICWKMMAKDPNDRQQNAEEVADDLTRFLLEHGQKVEGFTGTLSSLQRKKNTSDAQAHGELQEDAQKELESLGEIARLAALGRPDEGVSASSAGFGSGTNSALKRTSGKGTPKNGKPELMQMAQRLSSAAQGWLGRGREKRIQKKGKSASPSGSPAAPVPIAGKENAGNSGISTIDLGKPIQDSSLRKNTAGNSALASASRVARSSRIQKKVPMQTESLMDFLNQGNTDKETADPSKPNSDALASLNFTAEMDPQQSDSRAAAPQGGSSVKRTGTGSASKVNGGTSSVSQTGISSVSGTGKKSGRKKQEQTLVIGITVAIFIVLLILAFFVL